MISMTIAAWCEQSIVRVEHFTGQQLKPLSSYSSCILALLLPELYFYFPLEDLRSVLHDLSEAILEDFLSGYVDVHHVIFGLFAKSFELCFEYEMFVIEGQHVRSGYCHLEDGDIKNTHTCPSQLALLQFFPDAVVNESLEGWLTNALFPQS